MASHASESAKSFQTTYVDVIRHGQPEGGEVFRGRTNHALTDLGKWQFEQRIARHSNTYQAIISSPLQRCRYSAEWLAQQASLPLNVVTDWQEIDFGDWEDQAIASVMKNQADHAQQMWQDPLNFCAPGGESVPQLQQRMIAAWQDLLQQYAGQQVLLVSHGGVMRVLAQYLLDLAPQSMSQLAIPYAGFMRFRIDQEVGGEQRWVTLESLDGESLQQ